MLLLFITELATLTSVMLALIQRARNLTPGSQHLTCLLPVDCDLLEDRGCISLISGSPARAQGLAGSWRWEPSHPGILEVWHDGK